LNGLPVRLNLPSGEIMTVVSDRKFDITRQRTT